MAQAAPSRTYAAMSVQNLYSAILTMVSVHRTFYLESCLGTHHDGGKPVADWAEGMQDHISREVTGMVDELERRQLTGEAADFRDSAIAACLPIVYRSTRFDLQLTRPGGKAAAAVTPVAARDRLNEGVTLLHTAWLAMAGSTVDKADPTDFEALTDTVWQALTKFADAKKGLGE